MTKYPLQNFLTYEKLSPDYKSFVLNIFSTYEPQFYNQTVHFEYWREVMSAELKAMETMSSFMP